MKCRSVPGRNLSGGFTHPLSGHEEQAMPEARQNTVFLNAMVWRAPAFQPAVNGFALAVQGRATTLDTR